MADRFYAFIATEPEKEVIGDAIEWDEYQRDDELGLYHDLVKKYPEAANSVVIIRDHSGYRHLIFQGELWRYEDEFEKAASR